MRAQIVAEAAARWILLDLRRSAQEREREDRRDRRDRAEQRLRDDGFSDATIRYRPEIPLAWREQLDPLEHGLLPPFSTRHSGRKRSKPKKPFQSQYRWAV